MDFEAPQFENGRTLLIAALAERYSPETDLCHNIRTTWLPASGRKVADSPEFERYGQEYDPATGNGGFEIRIPLRG
jgi:predicted transcriptional regulator YdeE